MTYMRPQCFRCKHYNLKKGGCKAFPKGIPQEIRRNEIRHDEPYQGDNGIQFEPKEEDASD